MFKEKGYLLEFNTIKRDLLLIKQKQKNSKRLKLIRMKPWLKNRNDKRRPSGARGTEGASASPPTPLPPKLSADVSFFLISPLNVLFLKKVTQNIHENQQAKSRAN